MGEWAKDLTDLEGPDGTRYYEKQRYHPWIEHELGDVPPLVRKIANNSMFEDLQILVLLEDDYLEVFSWAEMEHAAHPRPDDDSFNHTGVTLREWFIGHTIDDPNNVCDRIKAYAFPIELNIAGLGGIPTSEKAIDIDYREAIPLWGSY